MMSHSLFINNSSADGGESSPQESSKSSSIIIPEDFESQKEMVRLLFLNVLEDVQAKHFTIGLKLMFQICFSAIPVEINHFMQTIRLTSSLPTTGGVYTRSFGSGGSRARRGQKTAGGRTPAPHGSQAPGCCGHQT